MEKLCGRRDSYLPPLRLAPQSGQTICCYSTDCRAEPSLGASANELTNRTDETMLRPTVVVLRSLVTQKRNPIRPARNLITTRAALESPEMTASNSVASSSSYGRKLSQQRKIRNSIATKTNSFALHSRGGSLSRRFARISIDMLSC